MPNNPLLDYLPQTTQSNPLMDYVPKDNPLMKYSVNNKLLDHAWKAITEPVPAFGGKTAGQLNEPIAAQSAFTGHPVQSFVSGLLGDVADIATTPLSYIPIPGGKLLGKIPLSGTTLKDIATKIPLGQLATGGLAEKVAYQDALKTLGSKVAESQAPLDVAKLVNDPVAKVTQALQEAQPIRTAQEQIYTQEKAKQAGNLQSIGIFNPGESGYHAQLGSLKGELGKVQFQGIRDKVSQGDIDSLFQKINNQPNFDEWDKLNAKNGLSALLGETGGRVPQQAQLDLLGQVFPQEFINTVIAKKPLLQKFGEGVAEVLNIPRALMSTFDMSAPLRQGLFMIGRPKQYIPSFGSMIKYFFDEKAYQGLLEDIQSRPTYNLMQKAKLPITDIGKSLSGREETFMSNLAEKIPLYGHVVRASDRAYTGFLNKLRADTFDDLIKKAETLGIKPDGKFLDDVGNFIGTATGRGRLPGSLEKHAALLNSVFFSPRLMASRVNLMNPNYYIKLDPFVRKEALKNLLALTGVAGTTLTLASLGGAKVGTDPRSADFGKIKVGNTRYDILGGFQQYIKFFSQLATGELVSSTTGVKTTVGEGYKPVTRADIISRFFQSKENPVLSLATNLAKGTNNIGQPLNIPQEVMSRFTPMLAQDLAQLYQEKGLSAIGMEIPGIFGVGVQTYSPTAEETVYAAKSVMNSIKKLTNDGKVNDAKKLLLDNREIMVEGAKLEPYQKQVSSLNKVKDRIKSNAIISRDKKQVAIGRIDQEIQKIQDQMDLVLQQMKGANANP